MYFHRQYTKSNPLYSSPHHVGITGRFDLPFQPQGGEIDYWLGQIPTLPVLGGVRLNIDRCTSKRYVSFLYFTNLFQRSTTQVLYSTPLRSAPLQFIHTLHRLCAYQLLAPLSPPGALGGDGSGFDKVDDQMLHPLGRLGNQIPT